MAWRLTNNLTHWLISTQVALGSFEGGQLWTGDRGVLDCREKWCLFDGNTEHATEPYTGKDRCGAASETFVEPRRRRRGDGVVSTTSRRWRHVERASMA